MSNLSYYITALLALILFLSGCAGVRNSYESLLDTDVDKPLIVLETGEKREVLVVGNGFPGWWGYYPAIASNDPEVASVVCKRGRSFIPFREPGIVFGGERCSIQTHKAGSAWLVVGNDFTLPSYMKKTNFTTAPKEDSPSEGEEKWIKLKVLPVSDR